MKITKEQLKQIIKEELEMIMQEEKSIEKDAMEIYRGGIDPQAAAEKLATMYSFRDFDNFRDAMQWKGLDADLHDWIEDVHGHMMELG